MNVQVPAYVYACEASDTPAAVPPLAAYSDPTKTNSTRLQRGRISVFAAARWVYVIASRAV